ncbi:acetylglutamate kinase [Bacillus niameyensis]|uniref:acetylglutamate kinase n=1 Tax=Bacillus niameyensis TaxID=1522308 RepID=UPI000780F654|nr:acetylglutamate kinase [Bacillus niameyensis]
MDKIIVIKCGGSMIETLSDEFFLNIKKIQSHGYKPIIVHGGGPAINKLLDSLQIQAEFINGLRKTTHEVMEVVEMVLSGSMTNKLVRTLQKHGISAIGITGSDGGLMSGKAKDSENLGLVGEITDVNQSFIFDLLSIGMIPVISPIAVSEDKNHFYNVNADSAAAAIALAVQAEKILFVTDVPGILKENQLIEKTTKSEMMDLIENGTISGGMIPKVMAAIKSIDGGMNEVMIVSGKTPLFKGVHFIGTTIQKELEAVN